MRTNAHNWILLGMILYFNCTLKQSESLSVWSCINIDWHTITPRYEQGISPERYTYETQWKWMRMHNLLAWKQCTPCGKVCITRDRRIGSIIWNFCNIINNITIFHKNTSIRGVFAYIIKQLFLHIHYKD